MEQRAGARSKRTPVWRAFSTSLVQIGLFAAVGFVIVSQAAALASGPVFWEISRQEDVVKGDARGITIADNGAISLAPALELVFDTKEAYIWSSAVDAQGNVYLGTGHDGRIFKVEPSGAGKLIYDAPELDVTAMTTDAQGNVYAGTSPDGKIYKITAAGQESVFYDPPDKYIWSLAFDPATSTLYAGTGDKGVIYKIDTAGKAAVLADTTETNILTLAVDKNGSLLAGTDPSGLVLRIGSNGKQFAVLDSPTQEIHSIATAADGSIYALGVSQTGGAAASKTAAVGVPSTSTLSSDGTVTITSGDEDSATTPEATPTAASKSKAEGARSALFRINPDGTNDVLWRANDSMGYSISPETGGRILVGTNNRGRIYEVASDRTRSLLVQSPEDQISTLVNANGSVYATSSNLGRLYRISNQTVSEGTYTSPVRDAKFAGQWGVINWRCSGHVELQTRTGNTETPDATWSEWSAAYKNPSGDQISSPRARFIQWRATLKANAQAAASSRSGGRAASTARGGDIAQLQSVVVAYLPKNQAPDITSLTVLPSGVALQEQPIAIDPSIASSGLDPQLFGITASIPPRRFYQKGARTLTWQASDANDDTLTYKILYRSINDKEWHLLANNLSPTWYTIDLNRIPDGTYLFKVIASDSPSNPPELALSDEQVTDAIEIDNTPPVIKVTGPSVSGQTAEIVFDATDATSRIIRGEYSVDGGPWQLVFPVDGIADSASESYRIKVRFETPGEHVIAFRVSDSSSNVGTAKVTATTH
ncbi:MAG TPA: hypothetical protein VKM94_10905 [Blastocatellia bacterium]|nr:hypothetical protein [Blastocatellia bacterium]